MYVLLHLNNTEFTIKAEHITIVGVKWTIYYYQIKVDVRLIFYTDLDNPLYILLISKIGIVTDL